MMFPVPDTSLADVAARAGVPVEGITALVVLIAPYLVSPLAAVWKRWRKTSGPDTRLVIKVLTALIVGAGGFALGLYGYDLRGAINAVFAALGAYLKATGDYERDVNVQAKANRISPRSGQVVVMPDTGVLPPADIASTDPTLLREFEPDPAATHFNLLDGFVEDVQLVTDNR